MGYLPPQMWNERDHQKREIGDAVMLLLVSREFGCKGEQMIAARKNVRNAIAACRASADQLNAGLRDFPCADSED